MRWFMVMLLTFAVTHPAITGDSAATPAAGTPYKEGAVLYVWAVKGLNLRQQPSPSAAVIEKLTYGASVTVLKQDEKSVPYRLEFFSYKNTADTLTQITAEQPQVILNGEWIRINAKQQDGYVFNKLLLDLAPKKSAETFEAYLVRVFNLTNHKHQKKQQKDKESGLKYTTVYQTFTSNKNQIVLKTETSDGDASSSGSGGKISIPGFSFEKAFIFFNAIMPPLTDHGFDYQAGQVFEYLLDEIGNTARLEKTKNGVNFEWYFGMN